MDFERTKSSLGSGVLSHRGVISILTGNFRGFPPLKFINSVLFLQLFVPSSFFAWKLIMQEMINHSELVCLPVTQSLRGRAFKQLEMSDQIQTMHLQCVVGTAHPTIKVMFLFSICNVPEMTSEIPNEIWSAQNVCFTRFHVVPFLPIALYGLLRRARGSLQNAMFPLSSVLVFKLKESLSWCIA